MKLCVFVNNIDLYNRYNGSTFIDNGKYLFFITIANCFKLCQSRVELRDEKTFNIGSLNRINMSLISYRTWALHAVGARSHLLFRETYSHIRNNSHWCDHASAMLFVSSTTHQWYTNTVDILIIILHSKSTMLCDSIFENFSAIVL